MNLVYDLWPVRRSTCNAIVENHVGWCGPGGCPRSAARRRRCRGDAERAGRGGQDQRRHENQAQFPGRAAADGSGVSVGHGGTDDRVGRDVFEQPGDGDQPPADHVERGGEPDQLDPEGEGADHGPERKDAQGRDAQQREKREHPRADGPGSEGRRGRRRRRDVRDPRESRDGRGPEDEPGGASAGVRQHRGQ